MRKSVFVILGVVVAVVVSIPAFASGVGSVCDVEVQLSATLTLNQLLAQCPGAIVMSAPDASHKAVIEVPRDVAMRLKKEGIALRYLRGITYLQPENSAKTLVSRPEAPGTAFELRPLFDLLGADSGTATVTGAPSSAKVSRIDLKVHGTTGYAPNIVLVLKDQAQSHFFQCDTSGWDPDETGLFDETIGITSLNDLAVNQQWLLIGYQENNDGGEYVQGWSITVWYDDGGVVQNPDLIVPTSDCTPLSMSAGGQLSLSATIKNQGTGAAYASTATWYIATHATPAITDTVLATKSVAALGSGEATSPFTQTASAPSTPGTYHAALKADSGNTNTESDENNNWGTVYTLTVRPINTITVSPAGFIEEGVRLTMTAPPGTGYVWKKHGVPMTDNAPRVLGVNSQVLVLAPAVEADSDVYTCTYNDGTKAITTTDPYTLMIAPAGSLPVAGPLALAILAALLGGIGVARGRKR